MHHIVTLTDADVLGTPGMSSAKPRLTARAIVMSPDNRCALMYAAKFGIYTLPGGGVEEGETIEEALIREITEETGCTIDRFDPLGYVEENRFHADYTQISYYYIVHTLDEALHPHLTALEAANGTSAMWCTLDEAYERIAAPEFERPQGKFLQARDLAAMKAYSTFLNTAVCRIPPEWPHLWYRLADYAEHCAWVAGPHLAGMLRENRLTDWEAVFAAFDRGEIIGYCTFLKTDYYPENRYSPWISSIFVEERHRRKGVCGLLIEAAVRYARKQGFRRVYIPSDMNGFYERFGFCRIDELVNYGGDVDGVFARDI